MQAMTIQEIRATKATGHEAMMMWNPGWRGGLYEGAAWFKKAIRAQLLRSREWEPHRSAIDWVRSWCHYRDMWDHCGTIPNPEGKGRIVVTQPYCRYKDSTAQEIADYYGVEFLGSEDAAWAPGARCYKFGPSEKKKRLIDEDGWQIIRRWGSWSIRMHPNGEECIVSQAQYTDIKKTGFEYWFEFERLDEDWYSHFREKGLGGKDFDDFDACFSHAHSLLYGDKSWRRYCRL